MFFSKIRNLLFIFGVGLVFIPTMIQAVDHTEQLGTHNMPNELRFHCTNVYSHCRDETRTHSIKFWAEFSYPSNETITRHLAQCSTVAAATGLLTAATLFVPAFKVCMAHHIEKDLLDRIGINVRQEHIYGNWRTH